MAKKITFKIITPEKIMFEEKIDFVTMDTRSGVITILPEHIPLVSILKPGEMLVHKDGEVIPLVAMGGFVEVRKNSEVIVLADSAQRAEEIDIKKAEEAKERAEKLAKEKATMNDVEYARVAASLERELARLRVARKYRHQKGIRTGRK